jgi:hypothetical protein
MHMKVKLFMFFMNFLSSFRCKIKIHPLIFIKGVERHFFKVDYDIVIF